MKFYKKFYTPILLGILLVIFFSSCEEEITSIGAGVIGGEPFETGKVVFDVFAKNKKINAVKTNDLPIYQLGNFEDPIYGKTTASILAQVQLSVLNPTFGRTAQALENTATSNPIRSATIPENETIKSVFLFIPYLTNVRDTDGDGVPDALDIDPANPNSDTDGDGLTDNQERIGRTNPLSNDTDGDGILDAVDPENNRTAFPKKFVIDSVFGAGKDKPFSIKVRRSSYFLRDLDPNTNFQQSQEYFSNNTIFNNFLGETIADVDTLTVRNKEIIIFQKDNPDTAEVDESKAVDQTIAPGIYLPLDNGFFQENILNKEGKPELLNNVNFKNYLRGIHIAIGQSDDIFMLLNLRGASITMTYTYDAVDNNGTATDFTDDVIEKLEAKYSFILTTGGGADQNGFPSPIVGNVVNTFVNEAYPTEILDALNSTGNAERIYLKGGAGAYAELKLFDEDNAVSQAIINELKTNRWIINEASLVFYVDREALDAAGEVLEPLRLYLYNTKTNSPLFNPANEFSTSDTNSLQRFLFYNGILQKENNKGVKYKVRITDYINSLLLRDAENVTIGLALTSDIGNIGVGNAMVTKEGVKVMTKIPVMSTVNPFGTILYGNNVNATELGKKLQLEISYTKAN
jgi:hypothetical protein